MVVPTVTVITASGNYTPPVGFKYIKVYAIGGGGRGGAATDRKSTRLNSSH